MEMFRDNYAIAIIADGRVAPEQDGRVFLPFGTEYKVRLKNKGRGCAIADIHLDGECAAKGIIIPEDGTVDLERFVKENLTSGRKFRLERLTHPGVKEPNESQNGLVEVRFYREKVETPVFKIVEVPIPKPYPVPYYPYPWDYPRPWRNPDIVWCNTQQFTGSAGDAPASYSVNSTVLRGASVHDCAIHAPSNAQPAATVEGSHSNQSFTPVNLAVDTATCVTLALKLMGYDMAKSKCACGFRRKKEKFCPDCGVQLVS